MTVRRILFIYLLLLGTAGMACAQQATAPERPRNIILFVSDGCGPASFTFAREYVRYKGGEGLAIDAIQVGSIHTYSANSRVTDSAAGATAFSSGVKTINGAIAMDWAKRPVATILEAAEADGMATGLVATSTLTHATPASFSAHVPVRSMYAEIAEQQLDQGIEVFFAGGVEDFLPRDQGGQRADGRNLLEEAASKGYQVVRTRAAYDGSLSLPVLGLFGEGHMAFEIDRDPEQQPSLAEMTGPGYRTPPGQHEGFLSDGRRQPDRPRRACQRCGGSSARHPGV